MKTFYTNKPLSEYKKEEKQVLTKREKLAKTILILSILIEILVLIFGISFLVLIHYPMNTLVFIKDIELDSNIYNLINNKSAFLIMGITTGFLISSFINYKRKGKEIISFILLPGLFMGLFYFLAIGIDYVYFNFLKFIMNLINNL